ncbi:hypothetical protein E4U30_001564 [Claviceps sp. LM220 group G6]|nr:hypothetical protein E4U15_007763 [Claviceps sp. LM218 group G6]KAG6096417.1 hypothetical protein E4U30_001564 [Claviceps sp. LM220 group G6]KAG6112912.1 hypothetical protein E4U31_002131 [Claviceps sp. LM219 group G6]
MWRARYARGRAIGEILMQQSMGLSRDKDEAQSRLHQNVSQSAGCSLQTGEKAVDKGQKKTRIRTGQMRMPKDPEADVVASRIRRLLLCDDQEEGLYDEEMQPYGAGASTSTSATTRHRVEHCRGG